MAEAVVQTEPGSPRRRLRPDWPRRLVNELLALFIALLLLLAVGLVLLDTAPGHRFIVDRIAGLETASGLNIQIGRIDGSVFGKSQLKNVRVSDPDGVFLTSPNIKLDWAPGAWLYNSLHIDSVTADRVTLVRLPKLRPTGRRGPILPGFDIHIGELRRPTGSRSGRRSAGSREAAACAARRTSAPAARWSSSRLRSTTAAIASR